MAVGSRHKSWLVARSAGMDGYGSGRMDCFMAELDKAEIVDLSHVIEDGMTTYKGLPGPQMCDLSLRTREGTAANYDDGSSFQIGRIDMVANTGTYVDCPFHRYADGEDLTECAWLAGRPGGYCGAAPASRGLGTRQASILRRRCERQGGAGAHGLGRYWGTDISARHPFLTAEAAQLLLENGAARSAIDSNNIDDTRGRTRPVHSMLLGAEIPICEHMTGIERLPDSGFRFTAVPPKVRGMGTFPVRAYALWN